ncbi:MAG: GatB/YqeY domain-containing protein [Paracoccaceae bacterium]
MDLRERIAAGTKDAMRAKDGVRLSTLRLIGAAIKDRDIDLRGKGEEGEVGDDEVLAILTRMVKQRGESVRAYEEGGRLELAARERAEIAVIEEYLPRQLTEQEVAGAIDAAVAETGASSVRDMGKVMGLLKARHAGRMDFGKVGGRVKARLS